MTADELQKKYSSKLKECIETRGYPRYLYKYRKLGKHTKDIIIHNRMYFSNPADFNDPFDFNLPIDVGRSVAELKEEDFIEFLKELGENLDGNNKEFLEEILEEFLEEYIRAIKNEIKNNIKLFAKKTFQEAPYLEERIQKRRNETGVCCFSKKHDEVLMWSHYAQDHKGICLKFDIKENYDFFSQFIIVEYEKEVDTDIRKYFLEINKFIKDSYKIKHSNWSYEEEVRVVKTKSMGFNCNNRFVEFEPSALKEIIFGLKTDDDIILKYKKLCKTHERDIVFSKMRLVKNGRFELEKIEL